jgi:hypothetical protein
MPRINQIAVPSKTTTTTSASVGIPTTAVRRGFRDRFTSPALNAAPTYAEEVVDLIARGVVANAAGAEASTVLAHKIFKHTNGQLYRCIVSGTLGTGEPATWIPRAYRTASPLMSAVGGTAKFLAVGKVSRANTSGFSPKFKPTLVNQAAGDSTWFATNNQTISLQFNGTGIAAPDPTIEGPWNTNMKMFRSLQGRYWAPSDMSPGASLLHREWNQPGTGWISTGGHLETEVFTDAVAFQCNANGPKCPRVWIDDVPLTEDTGKIISSPANQNLPSFAILFPEGMSRHRIRLDSFGTISAMYISAGGWARAPRYTPTLMIWQGDSISGTNLTLPDQTDWASVPHKVSELIGMCGVRNMSIGGTGYLQATNGNNAWDVSQANDNADWQGKVSAHVFSHGNNDGASDMGPVVINAKKCWSKAFKENPQAVIAVIGIWSPYYGAGTNSETITVPAENALYKAWSEWAAANPDAKTGFLRTFTDDAGAASSALRPVNNSGIPTGNRWGVSMVNIPGDYRGNSPWFMGLEAGNPLGKAADDIHPTDFGVDMRSNLIANWLDGLLSSYGM